MLLIHRTLSHSKITATVVTVSRWYPVFFNSLDGGCTHLGPLVYSRRFFFLSSPARRGYLFKFLLNFKQMVPRISRSPPCSFDFDPLVFLALLQSNEGWFPCGFPLSPQSIPWPHPLLSERFNTRGFINYYFRSGPLHPLGPTDINYSVGCIVLGWNKQNNPTRHINHPYLQNLHRTY